MTLCPVILNASLKQHLKWEWKCLLCWSLWSQP